jgi:hypothetical protein
VSEVTPEELDPLMVKTKTGVITSWGGGAFGFMRSLALLGPLTVPQIAQMRPTSRQRMHRLADDFAAEGRARTSEIVRRLSDEVNGRSERRRGV